MKRIKLALFVLSTGMIALATGSCFMRWLGDFVGDTIVFRNVD
jgi:hypothetical protein